LSPADIMLEGAEGAFSAFPQCRTGKISGFFR